MKKMLAMAALVLSSVIPSASVWANQFEGTWRTFDCVAYGDAYYELEMKFITGDLNTFGIIEESQVKYSTEGCANSDEISRSSRSYQYTNLYPANEGRFFTIDVDLGGRVVYDIIQKGRWRGVPHIFFGKGGPARYESQRPTAIDQSRRLGDSSFGG